MSSFGWLIKIQDALISTINECIKMNNGVRHSVRRKQSVQSVAQLLDSLLLRFQISNVGTVRTFAANHRKSVFQ